MEKQKIDVLYEKINDVFKKENETYAGEVAILVSFLTAKIFENENPKDILEGVLASQQMQYEIVASMQKAQEKVSQWKK